MFGADRVIVIMVVTCANKGIARYFEAVNSFITEHNYAILTTRTGLVLNLMSPEGQRFYKSAFPNIKYGISLGATRIVIIGQEDGCGKVPNREETLNRSASKLKMAERFHQSRYRSIFVDSYLAYLDEGHFSIIFLED